MINRGSSYLVTPSIQVRKFYERNGCSHLKCICACLTKSLSSSSFAAARVESTGQRNRIHLSNDTAELLFAGGKQHWCKKRAETVNAKGKGEMQTYWLQNNRDDGAVEEVTEEEANKEGTPNIDSTNHKLRDSTMEELEESLPPKVKRLVGWNVEILKKLLQQIVAKRNATANKRINEQQLGKLEKTIGRGMYLLDEVVEIIALPKFDKTTKMQENPNKIELPKIVVDQLRHYVSAIAAMYRYVQIRV